MSVVSLTYAPGNDTINHCVVVPVIDDNFAEGGEVFLGLLTTDEDRVTLSPSETTITIVDSDGKHTPYRNEEAGRLL